MKTITISSHDNYRKIKVSGETYEAYLTKYESSLSFVADKIPNDPLDGPCVYLLIRDVDDECPSVYVGEAEPGLTRIKQHIAKRKKGAEFAWTEMVVFSNIANEWTKSDIKFIENGIYSALVRAGRYTIENSTVPTKSKVSDPSLCARHIQSIIGLASLLGHPKLFKEYATRKATGPSKTSTNKVPSSVLVPTASSKIGEIAKFYLVDMLSKQTLTPADITYLSSPQATKDFKMCGNKVIKEYHGNPDEYCDARKKKRFYSIPPIKCHGKEYLVSSQFFEKGKSNLLDWLRKHGVTI